MENIIPLLLIGVITLGASYIQGVTGFGFGIFAMIFLPRILLYTEANLLSSILSSLTSVFVVLTLFRKIHWKNLVFPVIGCLFSTYAAVSFIKTQKNETLILFLGIALVALSLYFFFFSDKCRIKATWYAGLIAGIASGLLSGMFAIGGPPVVIYFLQSEKDTEDYLATISAYFIFSGVISVSTKVAAGFLTNAVLLGIAVGLFGMLVGSFVGKLTRDKVSAPVIKRAVYGVMAISGVVNILTALL